MKHKYIIFIILAVVGIAFAAGVPQKIRTDSIILGQPGSTDVKFLEFDTGDSPNNVSMFCNDSLLCGIGTEQFSLGAGANNPMSIVFDQGLGGSNLFLKATDFQQISTNTAEVIIGDGTADDRTIFFDEGSVNKPYLKWDEGSSAIVIANDGVTEEAILTGGVSSEASLLENVGSQTSVAASALTVDLKQSDGSTDPSGPSPVRISFRSSTAATGGYNIRSVTAALGITVPSGATLGHTDGDDGFIYVYALDNAGTVELAVSASVFDESVLQTTTTIDATADSSVDIYSTTGRSNVPIRLLLRLTSNQTTAGTWDANVTVNSPDAPTFTYLDGELDIRVKGAPSSNDHIFVAGEINCDGSSTIVRNFGGWIASVGNISSGACQVTTQGIDITSFIACQFTETGNINPDKAFSLTSTTGGVGGTFTVDCDFPNTGGDCTDFDVSVMCFIQHTGVTL